MKIYFAGSIRGGRNDKDLYYEIIKLLDKYGEVLTEHIGDAELGKLGEENMSDEDIYERDMLWVNEADVMVAEVTTPSLGVGYEIGQAEVMRKKILCLHRPQKDMRLSAMISGNTNITKLIEYQDIGDIEDILENFLIF